MNIKSDNAGLTLRAVIIAMALSLFLLLSTFYIAIKLGAAPWPIIFSVIVSASLIKALNRNREINLHEINVAQAGGSIGGLIAAGVAFTLPAVIYLNRTGDIAIELPAPWILGILIATSGLLGLLLSVPLKYTFIDEENLPYPAGTAGAELLKLSNQHGKELFIVLIIGSLVGIFTLIRDLYFPAGIMLLSLSSLGIMLVLLPLPIAVGAGYILGPRASYSWLAGAVIGWFLIVPIQTLNHVEITLAGDYVKNLGMGMVLGSGISFLLAYILPKFRQIFLPVFKSNSKYMFLVPGLLLLGFLSMLISNIPVLASILTLIGIWAMVAVAARMTGETNIDPLEQFGIFITLLIMIIYGIMSLTLPLSTLILIVMVVSVACAIAGDAGHDYKSAAILNTKFTDIVKIDFITIVLTGLAAPFVFEIFSAGFSKELFTPIMPAPQAELVAKSISGFDHPYIFLTGFLIAMGGELINKILPENFKSQLLWMPFGIGLFLGPGLAIPIALGATILYWINKRNPGMYHIGLLIAAGSMGAEGIAGFTAGALTVFGLTYQTSAMLIGIGFVMILLMGIWLYRRYNTT